MLTALLAAALAAPAAPPPAPAQKARSEADFVKARPAVGDTLPDLTVYDPAGNEVLRRLEA